MGSPSLTTRYQDDEFEHDFAPAWRFVGTYMHWTPEIEELTRAYVRRAFELTEDTEVPPVGLIILSTAELANDASSISPSTNVMGTSRTGVLTRRTRRTVSPRSPSSSAVSGE